MAWLEAKEGEQGGGRYRNDEAVGWGEEGGKQKLGIRRQYCSSLSNSTRIHAYSNKQHEETLEHTPTTAASLCCTIGRTQHTHTYTLYFCLSVFQSSCLPWSVSHTCCGENLNAGLHSDSLPPPLSFFPSSPPSVSQSPCLLQLDGILMRQSQREACLGRALTDLSPTTSIRTWGARKQDFQDQVGALGLWRG